MIKHIIWHCQSYEKFNVKCIKVRYLQFDTNSPQMYHSIVAVQCFYHARVVSTENMSYPFQGYSDCQLYCSGTSSKTNCWIRKGIQQPSGSVATKLLFPGCFISWTWSHRLLLASPTILPKSTTSPFKLALQRGQLLELDRPFGLRQNIPDQPPPCFFITKVLYFPEEDIDVTLSSVSSLFLWS